jgi:hypothetical protein
MTHIPSLLLHSGSAASQNVNVAQDESSAFATSPEGMRQNEKNELMRIGKEELERKLKEEVEAIKIAAEAQRAALRERACRVSELEQADTMVCEIHAKRRIQKLREEIYGERTVPGPIHKLPGEMLSTVFRYHVEDNSSPWILAKVCKTWMHTALRTPQLWCHLLISDDNSQARRYGTLESYVINGRKEPAIGRMQICSNMSQLQAALERSGAVLPLSLTISNYSNWRPSGVVVPIFIRFINYPLSERLGNLDFGNMGSKHLQSTTPITVGGFPLLRSMRLPYSNSPSIVKVLESVSVTSKDLETASFPEGVHLMPAVYSFWSRLKCVTIGVHRANTTGLNQVIDQLGGLESLEGPAYAWPNAQTPRAVLGNIREITLNCFAPHLARLRLPQLETLKFIWNERVDQYASNQYEQLSYPTVVNLEVSTTDAKWHSYIAGAFPAVKNFTLTWHGDDVMPINTLEAIPSVRNVTLRGSNSSTFGVLLFKALRLADEPILCPNLKLLSMDGVYTARSRLTPWIQKAIRFRKDIGSPFQEITVKWRKKEATVFPGTST